MMRYFGGCVSLNGVTAVSTVLLVAFGAMAVNAQPVCDVDPTSLDFGTVTVGDVYALTFTITNVGGGTLTGSVTEACDHYEFMDGGGPYSLAAGQHVTVVVEYRPTAAGTHNCTIETGTDCSNVSCTGVGELPPTCEVSPTSLDFGTVILGDYADLTFTVTNVGGGTLFSDVEEFCDHYDLVSGGGGYSLTAGQQVVVTVRFEPTAEGTHDCTVYAGSGCLDVSCTGVGLLPPLCQVTPTSLDFGTVTVGDVYALTFTITNVGGGTLTGSVSVRLQRIWTDSGSALSCGFCPSVDILSSFIDLPQLPLHRDFSSASLCLS